MKNILFPALTTAIVLLFVFGGCQKEVVSDFSDLTALAPSNQDTNAGSWKTVILAAVTDIAVPAPNPASSPEYQQELAATRQKTQNLTDAERKAITYWSAGSVLRWNQIMRSLIVKYNLAPSPNADGTYTFPNADSTRNNPFYYPVFPFANPPYAARAYAYTSVVQFDALIVAWHAKMQYQRPSAWQSDVSIEPLVPKTTLPAYPCEDAVVAGAAVEMLKLLFPGEKTYLEEKLAEAAWYKQWAGVAVASDVNAGLDLGRAVAAKVIARAKADGMKNAVGNQHLWDSLATRITTQGGTPWKSQDSPARPPMLPFFGNVQPLLFPASKLAEIRPPAPPAVGSADFERQLDEVRQAADPNDRDKIRIVHFWADGIGTATPPGHWNALAFEQIYNTGQSEVRAARTFSLLNMSMMDAAISCWETKYFYFYPRPSQMDASIKTLTGLPNFPSYTSGHSTFSAAASTILGHLFPAQASNYQSMAKEASLSRLYGGIHYPMDCQAGLVTGTVIGQFAVERAKTDGGE